MFSEDVSPHFSIFPTDTFFKKSRKWLWKMRRLGAVGFLQTFGSLCVKELYDEFHFSPHFSLETPFGLFFFRFCEVAAVREKWAREISFAQLWQLHFQLCNLGRKAIFNDNVGLVESKHELLGTIKVRFEDGSNRDFFMPFPLQLKFENDFSVTFPCKWKLVKVSFWTSFLKVRIELCGWYTSWKLFSELVCSCVSL